MLVRNEGSTASMTQVQEDRTVLMTSRQLVLDDLILVRNDPALAAMCGGGLFDDLAGHHARLRGERVRGAVTAEWIGPNTVQICYDV